MRSIQIYVHKYINIALFVLIGFNAAIKYNTNRKQLFKNHKKQEFKNRKSLS